LSSPERVSQGANDRRGARGDGVSRGRLPFGKLGQRANDVGRATCASRRMRWWVQLARCVLETGFRLQRPVARKPGFLGRFVVWSGLAGRENAQSPCPGSRLRPAMHAELAIDVAGVGLDGVEREVEPGRDLGVGQPVGNECKHLSFAVAQRLDQIRFGGLRFGWGSLLRLGCRLNLSG